MKGNRYTVLDAREDWRSHLAGVLHGDKVKDGLRRSRRIIVKTCIPSDRKSFLSGVPVNIDIVEEVARIVRDLNPAAGITIVEGHGRFSVESAYHALGYDRLAEKFGGVRLLDLEKVPRFKLTSPMFRKLGVVLFPETFLDFDYLINIASVRRHVHERYVGAMFNLLPVLQDQAFRDRVQPFLSDVLYDLAEQLSPDLNILDARVVLEETGPVEGRPKRRERIVVSGSSYWADVCGSMLLGEDPRNVPHLRRVIRCKKLRLDAGVTGDRAAFIPPLQYYTWRASLALLRWGDFIGRLGTFVQFGSFALMTTGLKSMLKGKWISIPDTARIMWDLLYKLNVTEALSERRITINKHIKEQTVS